jgi:hypothetical protein
MPLTTAQAAILRTDINSNADALALKTAGNIAGLADLYNAIDVAFFVWKTNVPISHVGDAIVASELAGLTGLNVDRLSCIAQLSPMGLNPSKADRRTAFDDIFSGAGGVNTRAALLVLWKRNARRIEKLFATGGNGQNATPATLVYEGVVTFDDIHLAVD